MAGLELAFDKLLAGKDGSATYEVGDGNRIPLGDNSTVEPRNGRALQLTIDRDLQWYAQRVLRDAVQRSGGDVRLGGRDGHPDRRGARARRLPDVRRQHAGAAPKSDLGSRALQDVYEPGSVEKVLTIARCSTPARSPRAPRSPCRRRCRCRTG